MTLFVPDNPPTYESHTPYSLSDWIFYMSRPEIDALHELALTLPADPVAVNIGAGIGTSALTLIASRPDLRLYTVDINPEAGVYGGLGSEAGVLKAAGYYDLSRYTAILGDSKAVGREWRSGPVHLVFVDGDHTREGCEGDLQAWWPHLVAGGVMAFHDYRKTETWQRRNPTRAVTLDLLGSEIKPYPDVDAVVEELLAGQLPPRLAKHLVTADTLAAVRKVA